MRLGEERLIRIIIKDMEAGSDLSVATSTIEIYNSAGSQIVAPTACVQSGTSRLEVGYFLTTGVGKTIDTAGDYRIVWRVNYAGTIREWQQMLILRARPS